MPKELTRLQEFKNTIQLRESDFKSVLPKHINHAKFLSVVVTAVQRNPDLLELNRKSLFTSCMDCAKDGLIPDGREAALIPFKGKVRYSPMIAGVTKIARNSGEIATIDAQVVCENDEYDSWTDEKGVHFKHKKCRGDRGKDILTFAYAITKDGYFYFEEIDEEQMTAIEKCSPGKNTPWKGPFRTEMKRKSALHRLCKYRLPSSSDLSNIISIDDGMYDLTGDKQTKEEPTTSTKSTLEDVVVSQTEPNEEPPAKTEKENIVDADLKDEDKPKKQNWVVEGIISDIATKSGETNGKKWTKYGCKIDNKYYGTFSESNYRIMLSAKDTGETVQVKFEKQTRDDKIFYNIIELKSLWDEEKTNNNEEIPI